MAEAAMMGVTTINITVSMGRGPGELTTETRTIEPAHTDPWQASEGFVPPTRPPSSRVCAADPWQAPDGFVLPPGPACAAGAGNPNQPPPLSGACAADESTSASGPAGAAGAASAAGVGKTNTSSWRPWAWAWLCSRRQRANGSHYQQLAVGSIQHVPINGGGLAVAQITLPSTPKAPELGFVVLGDARFYVVWRVHGVGDFTPSPANRNLVRGRRRCLVRATEAFARVRIRAFGVEEVPQLGGCMERVVDRREASKTE